MQITVYYLYYGGAIDILTWRQTLGQKRSTIPLIA